MLLCVARFLDVLPNYLFVPLYVCRPGNLANVGPFFSRWRNTDVSILILSNNFDGRFPLNQKFIGKTPQRTNLVTLASEKDKWGRDKWGRQRAQNAIFRPPNMQKRSSTQIDHARKKTNIWRCRGVVGPSRPSVGAHFL